ncbi:uroporphyrinogen-III C-methyltransferase [Lysobacter sp. SG-8]|uniref:Uroporphyrinogen-III C-methyltransferase n=1 Tax=Marilutibacter penaei TaxID=2759900 RepID=A0A7W3U267_9GAMM|nr:uroporphyrinogen-III C-methyltransferase [Lysobacter penaei]
MSESAERPTPSPRRRGGGWILALVVLVVLGAAGAYAWHAWQDLEARGASEHAAVVAADRRIDALNQRLDALQDNQRAQAQRLKQADNTNRVMRDELLGIGQRATLLEDSIAQWSDPARSHAQALRLEEVELLLLLGEQRLRATGDVDGARRNYALAAQALDTLGDPSLVNLRQALMQEQQAIEALGEDPRDAALAGIAQFAAALDTAPATADPRRDVPGGPWWKRAFSNVFDIQPRDRVVATLPAERADARAALQLELSLARAAAERRDAVAYRTALARASEGLKRLWPASAELDARQQALETLAAQPVSLEVPALGSTLQQLRQTVVAPPVTEVP